MRITVTAASRRDDILQRKAEYDRRVADRKAMIDKVHEEFTKDQYYVFAQVENKIREALGDHTKELNINVSTGFSNGMEVTIGNENQRDRSHALRWSWTARITKGGEVEKQSSSWSGLEATTLDQVEELKRIVAQLEIINNLDWANLLSANEDMPDYSEYHRNANIPPAESSWDWNSELKEADVEDLMGSNAIVRYLNEGRYYRSNVYLHIIRQSGSQYTVSEIPEYMLKAVNNGKKVSPYGAVSDPEPGEQPTTLAEIVSYCDASAYRIRKTTLFEGLPGELQIINY